MRVAAQASPTRNFGSEPGWRVIVGNTLWLLSERATRWAIGLTVGIWTARYLGPAGFGVLNATSAWIALFAAAAGFGIEPIVLRELVRRPGDRASLLGTAFGLRCIGGFLAAAAAILSTLAWPEAAPPLAFVAIGSLVTLFGAGEVFDLWFQANLQARTAAISRTLAFAIACSVRVTLILNNAPVTAFIWLIAAEATLTSAALATSFSRIASSIKLRFSTIEALNLLRESWPNMVSNIAAMGYIRADRVMLAWLGNDSAAGVYSASSSLVEMWYVLPFAVMNSATPLLTHLHSVDSIRYKSKLSQLARMHAVAAWFLFAALAGSAAWLMPVLFGAEYAGGSGALALLAGGLPFAFLGIVGSNWYLNEGLTRIAMQRHVAGGLLNLGLNLMLIPRFGAAGAAGATMVSLSVVHILANAISSKTRFLFHLQLRALLLIRAPAL